MVEWPKEKAHADRPLPLLHQLARHVVNGRDVVRIHRMPQTEGVGQQRRPEQDRESVEGGQRPQPRSRVEASQDDNQHPDFPAHTRRS
jgi:hypothetical protein